MYFYFLTFFFVLFSFEKLVSNKITHINSFSLYFELPLKKRFQFVLYYPSQNPYLEILSTHYL